ncbi:MAG: hypothetical protein N3D20_03310, partial [Candidatus Pacearchaeota archaeon]|nr:hypothetical protein [Candidatus Pacearchaeota archaeon]
YNGNISNSYSIGNLIGDSSVGGLVGNSEEVTISNSYSIANVTGNNFVGGLVGYLYNGNISNSYSIGNLIGDSSVGGLVGYLYNGNISNSFFNYEISGNISSCGYFENGECIGSFGKTTAEMKDIDTFLNSGWSISISEQNNLNNGYPFLGWQIKNYTNIWFIRSNKLLENCLSISKPGFYNLTENIQSPGNCIVISSDDVILNLNEKSVSAGGIAVLAIGRKNISVINGFINSSSIGVLFENVQNASFKNVSFLDNSFGLNLTGTNNLVENSLFFRNIVALSMTGNNSFVMSNSLGEIRWDKDLFVGGRETVNICGGGIPHPDCYQEITKYSRIDPSTISITKGKITIDPTLLNDNPSLAGPVLVKIYDYFKGSYSDRFLNIGVDEKICNRFTNPSCYNFTSLKAVPAVFNVSNIGNGLITLGFRANKTKRIEGYKGWNLVGLSNPSVDKIPLSEADNYILTDYNLTLSKGWNIINYPVPIEKSFQDSVLVDGMSLQNASRAGKIKGGMIYYNKNYNENNPSFKFVGVRNSGESTLRENRGYYIYSEENGTVLTFKNVVPIEKEAAVKNHKIRIGDIHFINLSSGEVRNITRAVEVLNKSLCVVEKNNTISRDGLWFGYGVCNCFMNNNLSCKWLYSNSTIYWWDVTKEEGKGRFENQPYLNYEYLFNSSQGIFVKFNYPDIAILLPGD